MSKTDYRSLVEGEWLGQWDLCDDEGRSREAVVCIESVEKWAPTKKQKKKQEDGTWKEVPSKRIKIAFVGKRKPWLAGPVSQKVIASMYGKYVQGWIGKRITLYVDPAVQFGTETTGGIRVKPTPPKLGATERTLDRPVDAAKVEQLDRAAGREPGEEG